ncbi:CopD family protein [Bacteroidetes bacterium endosymbiont of Geopemphigus sp.]|nr:CopD family protein [Bacteroidetes bacterium endosymbiont of Geopemphigus sp.]
MTLYSTIFNIIKALHTIFIVSYFAGIFYIVRLLIYHIETLEKKDSERSILQNQYIYMEKKLWNIIILPASWMVLITGLTMILTEVNFYFSSTWMQIKIALVFLLIVYHLCCLKLLRDFKKNLFQYTSLQLRLWNEIATLLLISIVLAVVLKTDFVRLWLNIFGSLILLGLLITYIVKRIKNLKK